MTIASTAPVRGSIATTAPLRLPSAAAAARCAFGLIVVSTEAPVGFCPVTVSSTRRISCESAVPASSRFIDASSPERAWS